MPVAGGVDIGERPLGALVQSGCRKPEKSEPFVKTACVFLLSVSQAEFRRGQCHEGSCFKMPDVNFHALGSARARSGEDPLVSFLLNARTAPVTISARDVPRIDSHRLQLLLVAQKQWLQDAVPFEVIDMSPGFREGLERLGLPQEHFDKEMPQ